jgi:hypothetical protein
MRTLSSQSVASQTRRCEAQSAFDVGNSETHNSDIDLPGNRHPNYLGKSQHHVSSDAGQYRRKTDLERQMKHDFYAG